MTSRICGALFTVLGLLGFATTVIQILQGRADWAARGAIRTAVSLIGGLWLLGQQYTDFADAPRRFMGIVTIIVGTSEIQFLSDSVASGTNILTWPFLVIIFLGPVLVVLGALSIWSQRFATWQRQTMERWRRRRRMKGLGDR